MCGIVVRYLFSPNDTGCVRSILEETMANDVTLGTASRQNLSALQTTARLMGRTQTRLSTGLKVSAAVDDAVAYFQGRALGERAKDLMEVKDGMVGAVGTIKTALTGLENVEKLLTQMKGIALSAKSEAEPRKRHALYEQYVVLRSQLDALAADTQFNGANLIGNPASDLSVPLSPVGVSPVTKLDISGVTITSNALGLDPETVNVTYTNYQSDVAVKGAFDRWSSYVLETTGYGYEVASNVVIQGLGNSQWLTVSGTKTLSTDTDGLAGFDAEGNGLTADQQNKAAQALKNYMTTGSSAGDTVGDLSSSLPFDNTNFPSVSMTLMKGPWDDPIYYMGNIDVDIQAMDGAIETVRNTMSSFGSSLALFQVRTQFNQNLANVALEGAGKLLDADLNEEGANMVALQTQAQLGLQALSFVGQSDQSVLDLF